MSKKKVSNLSSDGIEFVFEDQQYTDLTSNLELSNITTDQIRAALNRAPSKYMYWSHLLADVNSKIRAADAEYDYWYATVYSEIDSEEPKKTEGWKKGRIILNNASDWKKRIKRKSDLLLVKDKVSALVNAYEMQSRTLQTVAGLLRAEMELSG